MAQRSGVRPDATSARRIASRSAPLTGVSGDRTYAAGMRPSNTVEIALAACLEQLRLQVGRDAAHARDRAVGAEQEARHQRHRERRQHRHGPSGGVQRAEIRLERDDLVRPVLHRGHLRDLGETRERLGRVADARGRRILEHDDRKIRARRDLGEVPQHHVGLELGAPHEKCGREHEHARGPRGARVASEIDRVLRAIGVNAGDDGARVADLVQRDGQRAPALLAIERRDLGGVTVGDDAGDAAGVGEPA